MSEGLTTDQPIGRAIDVLMAKNAAQLLHRLYPEHLWAVDCDGKFLNVFNLHLSGQWGYRIRIDFVFSDAYFARRVMQAGGELLERYRMSRGKFNQAEYDDIPVSAGGILIAQG